jgi:hypothetical protein
MTIFHPYDSMIDVDRIYTENLDTPGLHLILKQEKEFQQISQFVIETIVHLHDYRKTSSENLDERT